MDSNLNVPSAKARNHGRSPSGHERRNAARRYTRGPLDQPDSDPLAPPNARTPSPAVRASMTTSTILSPPPFQPARTPSPRLSVIEDISQKDFSPLLLPETFHPIPPDTIPSPFLTSGYSPSPDTPLATLLKHGHFHAAAQAAAQQLISQRAPWDAATIFGLLRVRLASLCLVQLTAVAAAESKALGDLAAPFYRRPLDAAHIVPWDLRVLLVRLQALGFGEWRRGIMAYYGLAGEARAEEARAGKDGRADDREMWRARLWDLGVRVAAALVEMGDGEAAGRHLRSLETQGGVGTEEVRRILCMEALVWLRLGDVRAARACVARLKENGNEEGQDDSQELILSALLATSMGEFDTAISQWRALHEALPQDATIQQNLAVCLIYTGHLIEAKQHLETLIDSSDTPAFQPLLFNLCTMYELCTGKANEAKLHLAERVAAKEPTESGWEKASVEFKL